MTNELTNNHSDFQQRTKLQVDHFNVAFKRNEVAWHVLHLQRLVLVTVSSVPN